MFKHLKIILTLSSLSLLLAACSSRSEETKSSERAETTSQIEDDKKESEESKETIEEVREPDYATYPYFVDLSLEEEPITFSVYEGMNQLIIEATDAWSGQITHHYQPEEKSIYYTYTVEEVPTEELRFTYSGFSGPGLTESNTKLIIDKDGEDFEAYISAADTDNSQGYALVFPNQLIFENSDTLLLGSLSHQDINPNISSQRVAFYQEELIPEDFFGYYQNADNPAGPFISIDSEYLKIQGEGALTIKVITDMYTDANHLYITTDGTTSDQYHFTKHTDTNDGSSYLLGFGGETAFISDESGDNLTNTPSDADYSDEDLALMAYLKVRDYTNHDLNTDEFYIDNDPFGNGNLIVSGLTTGSSRVFEVDRENHRVYHWNFLDWSDAGPRTSRAEVLNSGAINRERPTDPEAEYYMTYDLMGEFANSYSIDAFLEGKSKVTHYDNSEFYDSLPQ